MTASPAWTDYYKKRINAPVSKILSKALGCFSSEMTSFEKTAIDLGCGAGHDTFHLLKNGWSVFAIDKQPNALSHIKTKACELNISANQLSTRQISFESISQLPKVALIHANLSLPFQCSPDFYRFWKIITESLVKGGRFSGSFFGDKDSWSIRRKMTFLEKNAIHKLFAQFEIELFEELEMDASDMTGDMKHWHIYNVVARL